ncbi:unnamed protein product [Acanthoscelides obtectus]|uniref:SWIM-type domain-containing protein n=1 Tax=Acanthoscelides obtectus TaxID=200917 RepID=A0A9P0KRZ4_ACAOB|nr:unnamed protein product [Acanthoscelides obtectus]CAK1633713.1 hypothetical protein AOBTE_LOCUS8338 [Acanthoscelides obtectus]
MDFSSVLNTDHREILHNMLPTGDGFEGIVLSSEPLTNGFSTKEYHCIHNTKPKRNTKPHEKHLNCNAKIIVTIKNKEMKRSNDVFLKKYPCEIFLRNTHNHSIYTSSALKFCPPCQQLQEEFKLLFTKGHSPSTAYSLFKDELYENHNQRYNAIVADGSIYWQMPNTEVEIECCTCFMGNRGGSCKHQLAVVTQFGLNSQQFHPTLINSDFKELLHKVVYGVNCEIEGWYLNLNDTKANEVVKIYNNLSAIEVPSCSSPDLHNIDINFNDIPPISTSEKDKIRGQLEHFVDLLMNRFENNFDECNQTILKFLKNVECCKTNSSLTSALCTFGKYNGTGLPKIKSGKNIQDGNRIGVQPTAIMRRKSGLGGRNIAQSGRPPKRLRLSDHAYSDDDDLYFIAMS